MLVTAIPNQAYQKFTNTHLGELSGTEIVWHHQLHPRRYAADSATPEDQPYDFSGEPMAVLQRVLEAGAIMRRFIVIDDGEFAERSSYMATHYQQMMRAGEELYIARMSCFVEFMARCPLVNKDLLTDYAASNVTNVPLHGAWEIQPDASDVYGEPLAIRDIVYASPEDIGSIHLFVPPYLNTVEAHIAGWVIASRQACIAIGGRVQLPSYSHSKTKPVFSAIL